MKEISDESRKSLLIDHPPHDVDMVFEGCSVTVKQKEANKIILNNASGIAKAGELTAIMGPSGAGKTTLMNVLAGRISKKSKNIEHTGKEQNLLHLGRFCSFVMQDDVLLETLTPRETLMFTANFKLNDTYNEKRKRVESVLELLQLTSCSNTLVGGIGFKGISGGERKRTSIGVELIGDPSMIILDEPTSGLDSFTSFTILRLLKSLAQDMKKTVIFTIHQPNSDIFFLFDRLILLKKGDIVYQGGASNIIPYFDSLSIKLPEYCNPADFYMELLSDYPDALPEWSNLNHENYQLNIFPEVEASMRSCGNSPLVFIAKKNSFLKEYSYICKRSLVTLIRNPMLVKGRIILLLFGAFLFGSLYFKIGERNIHDQNDSQRYIQNMGGAFFFLMVSIFMPTIDTVVLTFPVERAVFIREQNSKLYRVSSYFLGKMTIELIFTILYPIGYILLIYWTCSFNGQSAERVFVSRVLVALCGQSLGLMIGSMFLDSKAAVFIGPVIVIPFQMFAGLYVNLDTMPVWIRWLQFISVRTAQPFSKASIRNEFTDNYLSYADVKPFDPSNTFDFNMGLWDGIGALAAIFVGCLTLAYIFLKLLLYRVSFG